jgi:hypothetical protein
MIAPIVMEILSQSPSAACLSVRGFKIDWDEQLVGQSQRHLGQGFTHREGPLPKVQNRFLAEDRRSVPHRVQLGLGGEQLIGRQVQHADDFVVQVRPPGCHDIDHQNTHARYEIVAPSRQRLPVRRADLCCSDSPVRWPPRVLGCLPSPHGSQTDRSIRHRPDPSEAVAPNSPSPIRSGSRKHRPRHRGSPPHRFPRRRVASRVPLHGIRREGVDTVVPRFGDAQPECSEFH